MVYSSTNAGLSILFLVNTFHFLVALNKRKNKSMGNCISKINKDNLFAVEEFMKNYVFFSNGATRFGLHMLTGGTYTRLHSLKKIPEKITFALLQSRA